MAPRARLVLGAAAAAVVVIGGAAVAWFKGRDKQRRRGSYRGRPGHNNQAGGFRELQQLRQQREAAAAAATMAGHSHWTQLRILARALVELQSEAATLSDEAYCVMRNERGTTLCRRLVGVMVKLEHVVEKLDILSLADHPVLRDQRRACICSIQDELTFLETVLTGTRAANNQLMLRQLNTVLDHLCESCPDFCCPIMHDIMRQPVMVSTGKRYDASALRSIKAAAAASGVPPRCPLTTLRMRPEEERPDAELKRDIWRALEGAISEDVSSEEERAAMLRLWRREVATA